MKVQQMLEMAYICGLQSIEEAHLNVTRHSMSLFAYNTINTEERELVVDMAILGMLDEDKEGLYIKDQLVSDYLPEEERKTIDKDMEEYFQRND